jgi:hypothetical protein
MSAPGPGSMGLTERLDAGPSSAPRGRLGNERRGCRPGRSCRRSCSASGVVLSSIGPRPRGLGRRRHSPTTRTAAPVIGRSPPSAAEQEALGLAAQVARGGRCSPATSPRTSISKAILTPSGRAGDVRGQVGWAAAAGSTSSSRRHLVGARRSLPIEVIGRPAFSGGHARHRGHDVRGWPVRGVQAARGRGPRRQVGHPGPRHVPPLRDPRRRLVPCRRAPGRSARRRVSRRSRRSPTLPTTCRAGARLTALDPFTCNRYGI